jgi:hypothetical protein
MKGKEATKERNESKTKYVIVQQYFLNHSDIRTKRLHSDTLEDAYSRAEMLNEMGNSSTVKVI